LIALDRAERSGPDHDLTERSALQEVSHQFNIPVITIASLSDVLEVVQTQVEFADYRDAVLAYRAQYGVTA
jgi:orotate phosphoribosyltransferase